MEEFKELFSGYDFTSPSSYAACKEFVRQVEARARREGAQEAIAAIQKEINKAGGIGGQGHLDEIFNSARTLFSSPPQE